MSVPRSQPLTVGALVGTSLSIWLRNLVPFTLLSALLMAPLVAFDVLVVREAARPDGFSPLDFASLGIAVITSFLLTGAVTFGVVCELRGERASMAVSVAKGLQTFLAVLGTSLLAGIQVVLLLCLLIVPGVLRMLQLYVAVPVAVMEGTSGGAALRRSSGLTAGSRGALFGAHLLAVALVPVGVGLLLAALVAARIVEQETMDWINHGVNVLLAPLASTVPAVAYVMLRQTKENVDARTIAAVFD
jgi:hypothetical protein